jgi:hypothetical protein
MDNFGFFGLILFTLGVCITIAPLILWRNTNRTNRLLALQLARQGAKPEDVRSAWSDGGSHLASVPGYEDTGLLGAAKGAAENFKAAYSEAKVEDKPAPVPPKNRFCPSCGSDADLTASTCPSCSRDLAEHALYCPKCGHEISHRPTECPGCGVWLKWREAAS